jgi:hypothetical protein
MREITDIEMMAARKLHAARLTDCGKGHHEFWMAVSRIVDDQEVTDIG